MATLLVTDLPRVVPCGGPRVQLMRAHTQCVMIIVSHRGVTHGRVACAYHTVHHHVLSVELLEMVLLLRRPVRLSGDRRAIERCQARAGEFRIIDARGRVPFAPVLTLSDGGGRRLFGEAVSIRRCGQDKRLQVNAKQRDATDE